MPRRHKYAQITQANIQEMCLLRRKGWPYARIGRKFGTDHSTIIYFIKKKQGVLTNIDDKARYYLHCIECKKPMYGNNWGACCVHFFHEVMDLFNKNKGCGEPWQTDYFLLKHGIFGHVSTVRELTDNWNIDRRTLVYIDNYVQKNFKEKVIYKISECKYVV